MKLMMRRLRRPTGDGAPPRADESARRGSTSAGRLRRLGDILLIAGGLVLAYPLWSAAYAQVQQTRLDADYRDATARFAQISETASPVPSGARESQVIRRLATTFEHNLKRGDAIGRLKIPSIALDRLVQQGVGTPAALDPDGDRALLRNGPVHYAVTPLPGAGEPFAVAGHRTTYGAPFAHLDTLRPGDEIVVETPYARFRYEVAKKTVVKPTDVGVLLDRGYGLVLTTCTPPYSASHRLVVWATLESATARDPEGSGHR
jgi:sortase A